MGSYVEPGQEHLTTNIFVGNLDPCTTEEELTDVFREFGEIYFVETFFIFALDWLMHSRVGFIVVKTAASVGCLLFRILFNWKSRHFYLMIKWDSTNTKC